MKVSRSDISAVLHSRAFQLEAIRSERTRILWTIIVVGVLVAVVIVRTLIVRESDWQQGLMMSIALGGIALGYEIVMLLYVNRRIAHDAPIPDFAWRLNVVAESLFPTFVILVATSMDTVGPYRALVIPAVYLYFLAIILSTLRLRPALCHVAGAISAVGYLGMILYTFRTFPTSDPTISLFNAGVFATGAVLMLVGGAVAAAVASQIRNHVALALKEAQERRQLEIKTRNTLIFGLAKLAEYRDTDTGAHLERISTYSVMLAEKLQDTFDEINPGWIEILGVAASMHDIGKVGIPDGVLLKKGRLDQEERKVIERHPSIGSEALTAIQEKHGEDVLLEMSNKIAIGHHERWDGTGYPNRVPSAQVALAARIISVVDVYDALTSARVYKPAMSHEESCRIIGEGRGTQFDPVIVDAFLAAGTEFDHVRERLAG